MSMRSGSSILILSMLSTGSGLAEPDEGRAHEARPIAIAGERPDLDLGTSGQDVGSRDGQDGGHIAAAILARGAQGIGVEGVQLGPFLGGVEIGDEGAAHDVGGRRDVVAGAEAGGAAFDLERFGFAEGAQLDQRPFGEQAQGRRRRSRLPGCRAR